MSGAIISWIHWTPFRVHSWFSHVFLDILLARKTSQSSFFRLARIQTNFCLLTSFTGCPAFKLQTNPILDAFDGVFVERCGEVEHFWFLDFCAVVGIIVSVWRILWTARFWVAKFFEGRVSVTGHGNVTGAIFVIPVTCDSAE